MAYATADLKDDLDALAQIENDLVAALGDGSGSTTVSGLANGILERILATEEVDLSLDMLRGANQFLQACLGVPTDTEAGVQATTGVLGMYYWNALRTYYGDLTTALNDLDVRMHPLAAANYQKANGVWPDPSLVFPLATKLATLVRGVSLWTFTDNSAIDGELYAPAAVVLTPVGTIGVADVTVVMSLTPSAGASPVSVTVVLPAGSTSAAPVSIGAGRYLDILSVSCSGGTQNDQFTIDAVLERDLPNA